MSITQSIITRISIMCDQAGCESVFNIEHDTKLDCIKAAKRCGWKLTDRHLCPDHAHGEAPLCPEFYRCAGCSVHGVRLWLKNNTSDYDLLCIDCSQKEQGLIGTTKQNRIGWRLPAVPHPLRADIKKPSYWGYGTKDTAGRDWWHALPLRRTA